MPCLMLIIDDMKEEDISGVCLVEEECFSIPWSYNAFLEELPNENAVTLIAIDDMEIVGFVNARFLLGEGSINNIAVTKQKRRHHVGDSLMKLLIKRAAENGVASLTLEVRESNSEAIAFYQNYGFLKVGERKNFYDKPQENAVLMTLTL